jgi:signal peptidase II
MSTPGTGETDRLAANPARKGASDLSPRTAPPGGRKFGHPMSASRVRAIHVFIAAFVLLLDRWTKWLASTHIAMYRHIQIIPGFFRLTHTENTGAAFSLFADSPSHWKTAMLIGFSVLAMIIVSLLLWKQSASLTMTGIALSLILGGAVGNLWDRVASGRVVDFLLLYVKQYQWPVFNFADSAIVVGACLLVIEILFGRPHPEG